MADDIVERIERDMREPELLAFLRKMRTREDEIHDLRPGKIGNAIADQDSIIFIRWKPSYNGRLAHAAASVVAFFVAGMRPSDLDRIAAKVAAVAVDVIRRYTERFKQRVDEEIDASARDEEGHFVNFAPFQQFGKSCPDPRVVQNIGCDFFAHRGWKKREHFSYALLNRFALVQNIGNDRFPARRVEMFHYGYDIIVQRDRAVEIAEQYGFARKS